MLMKTITMSLLFFAVTTSWDVDFDAVIKKVNSAGASWKAGLPTITASTIVGQYCAWKTPPRLRKVSAMDDIVLPEEFDSRLHWPNCPTIRSVRNQGKCGCCWGCQPYEIAPCGRAPSNSSRPECNSQPVPQTPQCQTTCTNPSYGISFSSDHRRTQNEYQVSNVSSEIQKEILTHGPVESAFTVYSDFPTYQSGIYRHLTTKVISRHAVKIIGWGSEEGVPYWLISNSFDTDWGEGGFFRMLRGSNECEIENDVTAGVPLL